MKWAQYFSVKQLLYYTVYLVTPLHKSDFVILYSLIINASKAKAFSSHTCTEVTFPDASEPEVTISIYF